MPGNRARRRKSKKTNPRKVIVTAEDVKKATKAGVNETVSATQVIFFTVLRDKEGYDIEKLKEFWKKVQSLSDEILEERVSIGDLRNVLREEAGIYI